MSSDHDQVSSVSPPQMVAHQAAENLGDLIARLDLASVSDQEMSSNLLTVALHDFLNQGSPGRFGLARTKLASQHRVYATLFIVPMDAGYTAEGFTATGVVQSSPNEQLPQERLLPASLGMDDHVEQLRSAPGFLHAKALVEQAALNLCAAPAPSCRGTRPGVRL